MTTPRRIPPKVVRQEVYWVNPVESRLIEMPHGQRPYRLWSLFRDEDPKVKPPLPILPSHRHNAFLEDYVHDWNEHVLVLADKKTRKHHIHYYSRITDTGLWVLMEFTTLSPVPV